MSIEELNKLIDEIEWINEDYKRIRLKRKEERVFNKKKETKKIKRNIIASCCIPLSLVGLINLYLFLEKEINNPYRNNNLKITEEKALKIKSKIEQDLNIIIENNQIEEYLLLNAILENNNLTDKQKTTTCTKLINIIEDNPYIDKEYAYNSLLNVNIQYKERPTYKKKEVVGEYNNERILNYTYNDILIYNTDYENVLEHELIHCLLLTPKNDIFPCFITEGITELINDEYFSNNPYIELECYPFEILVIKMLCEITTEDIILKTYTTGNINILYNELLKIDRNTSPEKLIQELELLLNDFKENNKININQVKKLHNQLLKYFIYSKKLNQEKNSKVFSSYLKLFDCLKEKDPYYNYVKIIEENGYISKSYFNKDLTSNKEKNLKKY